MVDRCDCKMASERDFAAGKMMEVRRTCGDRRPSNRGDASRASARAQRRAGRNRGARGNRMCCEARHHHHVVRNDMTDNTRQRRSRKRDLEQNRKVKKYYLGFTVESSSSINNTLTLKAPGSRTQPQ